MTSRSSYDPTKAEYRLAAAIIAFEELKRTKDWDEIQRLWTSLLYSVNGVFQLMNQIVSKSSAHRIWYEGKKAEITADPLLQYVRQSRNADEHTTQFVSTIRPHFYCEVDSAVTLDFDFENGRPITKRHDGSIVPMELSYRVALNEVEHRGVTYHPPESHLGKPLSNIGSPLEVGGLAIDYICDLLEEANRI